jgi:dolichol-phosphate mannosyltransferase
MELSIVIPAYKEAENLDIILTKIKEVVKDMDYEIIIIDTMEAMDNTEEVCTKHTVKYFHREGGNTYGDAIRSGFQKATKEYLLIMDADGSHSPDDFHKMFKDCTDYDLTIGSRYVKGGKTDNPAILIFMSQVVNVCYRIVLGVKVKDVSNSFRLYRTKDIQKLHLDCSNFDIVEEILIKLSVNNKKYRIREVPISFNKRMYGESKRDLVKFAFSYISSLSKLVKISNN